MADLALVIPRPDGEIRISLHPISLALVLSEIIEETAHKRCFRRGHRPDPEQGHCGRCGTSLPDDGTPWGSWLPDVYRSFKRAETRGGRQ